MLLFELTLKDHKRVSALIKTCETACSLSDTAMIKIKPKGLYIMLTDMESFSCLEIRMLDMPASTLRLHASEYTVKIILDSFVNILRTIQKHKHTAVIVADHETPLTLQIRQVNPATSKVVESHSVESAEHRARVFHVSSTTAFRANAEYSEFRIPSVELNKIITMQCIISGNSGGVGEINVKGNDIQFYVKNGGGMGGGVTIHGNTRSTTVPILHSPAETIHTKYLLTYLKRAQNLFSNPSDNVTIYVSKKGFLLQTDIRDGHSVLVFIADVSNEDLQSYA